MKLRKVKVSTNTIVLFDESEIAAVEFSTGSAELHNRTTITLRGGKEIKLSGIEATVYWKDLIQNHPEFEAENDES